ncbi:MAG: hypothetical protein AB1714_02250 [Acidobacteriota bacterium]
MSNRSIMLRNSLTVACRNIARHKGCSFINIACLALGMSGPQQAGGEPAA